MTYRRALLLLLCFTASVVAFALPALAQRDVAVLPRPPQPALMSAAQARIPVRLQAMQVKVEALAGVATIEYDMTFFNPNNRVLEGQLQLPLLADQQVIGFALDIDGKLRDAVPVQRERAQAVFEEIVRRGVDPGLLEQTDAGLYRLRVYPLPPQGQRQVRITVMQPLTQHADVLQLPVAMGFASGIDSVPVTVVGDAGLAVPAQAGVGSAERRRGRWSMAVNPKQLNAPVQLHWPLRTTNDDGTLSIHDDGQRRHALLHWQPDAHAAAPARIEHLGVLWDASLSNAGRDRSMQLAVLTRLIRKAGAQHVTVHVLRDVAEAPRQFTITAGDTGALHDFLAQTVADGASNPGGWQPQPGVQRYVYIGDGRFTVGDAPPRPQGVRVDTLSDARNLPNTQRLQAWAEATGGRHISIAGMADLDPAAERLLTDTAQIERIEAIGMELPVLRSRWADAQGRFAIASRMRAEQGQLTVTWRDGRGQHITEFNTAPNVVDSRLAGRLWAQWRIAALQDDPRGNRSALQTLGSEYAIPNAQTSLLVLEEVMDYVNYDITPPPELRDAYNKALANKRIQRQRTQSERLDGVVQRFDQRITWWETTWPKTRAPAQTRAKQSADVASPPSPPAPMMVNAEAAAPPAAAGADALDRVAVTSAPVANAIGATHASPALAQEQALNPSAVIRIQPWQSDSPTAKRLRAATAQQRYAVYLDAREQFQQSPAFYLEAADVFIAAGQRELALRVLSNLAQLQIEDRHLLRVLAYRLLEMDEVARALPLLEQVRELASHEPQSHRDLGLALARAGQYQAAADALYEVIAGDIQHRFAGMDQTALAELNALIAAHPSAINTAGYDPRLLRNLPVGLRVVLGWDADNSDMDLWVTDPHGERAYYGNRNTRQGGRLSEDATQGYGPEEFVLRDPIPGVYKVEVNYFGDSHQIVTGPATVSVWMSSGFGTAAQVDRRTSVRLTSRTQTQLVGEFEVK